MSYFAFIFDSGATVRDLFTYYGVTVKSAQGLGMAPQNDITIPYALGDGTAYQRTIVGERVITLVCVAPHRTLAQIHSTRKKLIADINRDKLNSQTFTLRYYGAGATSIDIPVRYHGGLELSDNDGLLSSPFPIQLLACDPFWTTSAVITETFSNMSAVANSGYIAKRASDGTWTGLSGTNSPAAGATQILAANGKVYVASGSKLHVLSGGVWTAYTANAAVNCMCLAPDGSTIYIGGAFTIINGVSASYFAILTGTTFTAAGSNPPAEVRSISWATSTFVVLHTGGNTVIYWWDGASTWTVISGTSTASTNNPPINTLLATGGMGGAYALYWISDNTSTDLVQSYGSTGAVLRTIGTAALGSIKTAGFVNGVAFFIGGSFTSVSGITTAGMAYYSGYGWGPIPGSATTVNALSSGTTVYAGGTFLNYIVNATGWASLGAIPPVAVTALFVDPVTGMLYASWNSASNMTTGTDLSKTITNPGDRFAYPSSIVITRTGGTSAVLTAITNTSTGKAILFNYSMGAGEVITIVLTPGSKSITSSSGASIVPLPGSAFSTWALSPGAATYTISVTGVGTPVITAVLTYSGSYQSVDSVGA